MLERKKSVKLKKLSRNQQKELKKHYDPYEYLKVIEQSKIEIKLAPTLNDKYEVLDNYYAWLSEEERDANLAQNLTKYKDVLRHRECLKGAKEK